MRYRQDFPDLLQGFELGTLERDAHVIYALSADLELIYFNPAWFRFARENHGEPAISQRFGLGTPAEDFLPAVVRDFYQNAYREALRTGEVWHHDYECSTPTRYRLYHQTSYPFHNGAGLLLVHSLCEERPHQAAYRPPQPPDTQTYRSRATGLVTQCCNCRRIQRPLEPVRWDWVPAWVERMPERTTSGLCPLCYEYYWAQRPA